MVEGQKFLSKNKKEQSRAEQRLKFGLILKKTQIIVEVKKVLKSKKKKFR